MGFLFHSYSGKTVQKPHKLFSHFFGLKRLQFSRVPEEKLEDLLANYHATLSPEDAERFIRRIFSSIHLYILPRVPVDIVEDVRSEALRDIAYNLVNIGHDWAPERIWGWCYMIAKRRIFDYYKEHAKTPFTRVDPDELERLFEQGIDESSSPAEIAEARDAVELLKNADENGLELLWQVHIVGETISELAAQKGKSYDAVRMEVERSRQRAETILRKADDGKTP
jgi:DNA-directed RNA polymerase specialized sigma24 family protein